MDTEYDYLFKIVLIGDAGVGKTSIVRRYTDGIFTSAGIPTIGVDFCIKTLQIGGTAVKVRIHMSQCILVCCRISSFLSKPVLCVLLVKTFSSPVEFSTLIIH